MFYVIQDRAQFEFDNRSTNRNKIISSSGGYTWSRISVPIKKGHQSLPIVRNVKINNDHPMGRKINGIKKFVRVI